MPGEGRRGVSCPAGPDRSEGGSAQIRRITKPPTLVAVGLGRGGGMQGRLLRESHVHHHAVVAEINRTATGSSGLRCWRWRVWARPAAGLVLGPGYCGWTGLLRLDRASAVGPSESAFQVVQRQPGGPSAARRPNGSQAAQRQPDGPTAARRSGCGGADSGRCGCLGRRRTQGQRSRCPRPRTSPARPAAGPGLAVGRAGLRARLGRGPGSSSKTSQPIGQGGPVGDQTPWPAYRIRAVGRQLGAKVSRIGTNTPPVPAGAHGFVGIMRI